MFTCLPEIQLALPQLGLSRTEDQTRPGLLVVEDEATVRNLLHVAMRRQGFQVFTAANGLEAIHIYHRHRADIDVVLLDVRMPVLDGPDTLIELQQIDPEICACFMTGSAGLYTEEELLHLGAVRVFAKPFRLPELCADLWQLAQRSAVAREIVIPT